MFAAATSPELLTELGREQVELLIAGEISGLNGLFLGAAASREIPGLCLLGEFPFFAAGDRDPDASPDQQTSTGFGLTLDRVTPEIARRLRLGETRGALLVVPPRHAARTLDHGGGVGRRVGDGFPDGSEVDVHGGRS